MTEVDDGLHRGAQILLKKECPNSHYWSIYGQ